MLRLNLRQLLIFTAVADAGSTTAAGIRVSLSQSATSAALNELETLLGARLFDRVGKRLLLNDSGRALLPQARALLDSASGIEREFGVNDSGAGNAPATRLRVGASTTIGNYLLPALVATYQRDRTDAHIDVRVGNTREVSALVSRFEVDVGLIEGPCHEREVRAEAWIEDELVIVCAPEHPLLRGNKKRRVTVDTLKNEPWLLREPGSGTRETVEQVLLPHLDQLREGMQFGSTEAIKHAAAAGLGLTCLSRCAVQDLITLGGLVPLKTTLPRLSRRFYLIHHDQKRFTRSLTQFITHCRGAVKTQRVENLSTGVTRPA
jgi:DNA-binding transcriptional LysR family regulator